MYVCAHIYINHLLLHEHLSYRFNYFTVRLFFTHNLYLIGNDEHNTFKTPFCPLARHSFYGSFIINLMSSIVKSRLSLNFCFYKQYCDECLYMIYKYIYINTYNVYNLYRMCLNYSLETSVRWRIAWWQDYAF